MNKTAAFYTHYRMIPLLQIVVFWILTPNNIGDCTLKMEKTSSSKMLVTISNTTWYQNSENHNVTMKTSNLKQTTCAFQYTPSPRYSICQQWSL